MTATLTQLAANLAKSNLAANLSSGGTTLSVTPGQGALFPNPGANQFFALTLKDAATGTFTEIVYVTARSGDTFTIVRAQEGTSARAWVSGDQANNLFTAGSFSNLVQLVALQQQAGNYASASLGNNNITVTLSTVPAAYTAGLTVRFKKNGNSNTTTATLNVNGLGAAPIVHQDLTATVAGDLPANGVFTVVYDATSTNFVLQGASAGVSLTQLQQQSGNFGDDTSGTANALVVTLSPPPASLGAIQDAPIRIRKSALASTGTSSLALNGFAVTPIVWGGGSTIGAGDLPANSTFEVVYDGTNFVMLSVPFVPPMFSDIQQQLGNYAQSSGTNTLTATLAPAPSALTAGLTLRIRMGSGANTAAATLNVNGLGAVPIVHQDQTATVAGDLAANSLFTVVYDGTTNFVLQGASAGVTATQLQQQQGNAGTDSGTANALVVTLSPAPASLAAMADAPVRILKSGAANTGAPTLALNGFTATPIVWGDGSALGAGDLPAGSLFTVLYDGTTNFVMQSVPFVPPMFSDVQAQAGNYVADTGSGANIYVATLSPALTAPVVGMPIRLKIAHTNSGASTLNVNGLGAVAIHDSSGNALTGNALRAGMIAEFYYDGSAYQLAVPAFTGNIIANGNYLLPGGLVLQWGTVSFTPSGGTAFFNVAFTFLTPFPSACFMCVATGQNKFDASSPTTSGSQDIVIIYGESPSGATARIDNNATNAMSGNHTFQYFAIGK